MVKIINYIKILRRPTSRDDLEVSYDRRREKTKALRENAKVLLSFKLILSYDNFRKLVGNVGEKRHLASSLDRGSELSLVKSAVAANTSGEDLCSLGNELSELCNVLVVDLRNLVLAEDANLLSSVVLTVCGTLSIVSIHFR